MIPNTSPNHEDLASAFLESWQPEVEPLKRIANYLAGQGVGSLAGAPCDWLAMLAERDLVQAWRHWHSSIVQGGRILSPVQLLQKFEAIPTAATYQALRCLRCESSDFWNQLVHSEAAARSEFGDARGDIYFKEKYGVVTASSNDKPRRLRVKFEDRSRTTIRDFDVPLRGVLNVGRQPTDEATIGWSEDASETRVVIATAQERAFSRHQLMIRLLTPDHVLISNCGTGAMPPDSLTKALPPGNSQLVTFPFMITLPGRKLVGS